MLIFVTPEFKKGLIRLRELRCNKILNEFKISIKNLYDKYSNIADSIEYEYSTKTIKEDNLGIVFNAAFQNDNGAKRICINLGTLFKIPNTYKENDSVELLDISFYECLDKIDTNSFLKCDCLRNVNIPKNIKVIKDYAFAECENLKSIYISDGVEQINQRAFVCCKQLEYIRLPKNVNFFGGHQFIDCENLENVESPEGTKRIPIQIFIGCKKLKNIFLPESVEEIWGNAFEDCCSLEKIIIPNNVKQIDDTTFIGCCNLKEITYHKSLSNQIEKMLNKCSFKVINKEDDKHTGQVRCKILYPT